MARRDWRQQTLVLALLTLAAATAVGVATAAYNLAPVSGDAEFGTADHALTVEATTTDPDDDPADDVQADIDAADTWFGTIDVIGHRAVAIPGRFEPIDHRDQDPLGQFGRPKLRLRDGRYPERTGEVAVTDGIARELLVGLGEQLDSGGVMRTVVGFVENPSDLGDEFALVSPGDPLPRSSATVLVRTDRERIERFRPPSGRKVVSSRGDVSEGVLAAASVLAVAAVALLFVGLLAAAGFVVLVQRRQRQLGVLAAIGATERHLRITMMANGLLVGAVAGVVGAILGLVGWIAAEPRLETAVGYRVERFDIPWWVLVSGIALAVIAASGAAWWPARVASRASIVSALSGRPPAPRAPVRSVAVAAALGAVGIGALVAAGDVADDTEVRWTNVGLVVGGTIATVIAILFLCPLAVRLLGFAPGGLPVAVRIACRDLARYRGRAGAALSALVMALGIPVAIVVAASAAEHSEAGGNLPPDQWLVRGEYFGPFVPPAEQLASMRETVGRVAAALGGASTTTLELEAVVDPTFVYDPMRDGRLAITLVERAESDGWRDLSLLYVATPEVTEMAGIEQETVATATGVITAEQGELGLLGLAQQDSGGRRVDRVARTTAIARGHSSLPSTFVTVEEVTRRGWEVVPAGRWVLDALGTVTEEQRAAATAEAATGGLTLEARDEQAGLGRLRSGATAVGVLVALGVLAATVGLIRGESASELRALAAAGAPSSTRRALTACTAGGLATLAVVLGSLAAFTVLRVGYLDDLGALPVAHLLVIVVGTPVIASAFGWLLAGREPPAIGRQAIS